MATAFLHLALVLLITSSGCATRAWMLTQSYNTLYAYETFLKQHPRSRYAVDAWARLDTILLSEAVTRGSFEVYERFFSRYAVGQFADDERMEPLYFRRASAIGCLFAYEAFLREFPRGDLAEAARRDTAEVHRHLRALAAAAAQGLPGKTHFRVSRELAGPAVPEYIVTAALIPGRDLDDGNPGHYFTSPAYLARAVRCRCLDLARAVSRLKALPADAPLVIRVRQGIGLESMGFTSSHGRAMTIFAVAVPSEILTGEVDPALLEEDAVHDWDIRENLVPQVTTTGQGGQRH